jgi:hypothetical protein
MELGIRKKQDTQNEGRVTLHDNPLLGKVTFTCSTMETMALTRRGVARRSADTCKASRFSIWNKMLLEVECFLCKSLLDLIGAFTLRLCCSVIDLQASSGAAPSTAWLHREALQECQHLISNVYQSGEACPQSIDPCKSGLIRASAPGRVSHTLLPLTISPTLDLRKPTPTTSPTTACLTS